MDGPYYLEVHLGKRVAGPSFALTVYKYGDPGPKEVIPQAFGPRPKTVGKVQLEVERGDPAEVALLFSAAKCWSL